MRKWLKTSRIEKGFTMKALSEKLGISESYYCAIENGTRQEKMDMSIASRLSEELEIPLDIIAKNERLANSA
jgi:Uncharacterized protein conserved in bacteria